MPEMQILDLMPSHRRRARQIAEMLVEAFREHWPRAWPTLESAMDEVQDSFGDDRISRVAVDEHGRALGWIGGVSMYDGNVWELHPMVVRPDLQGQGIGRALVEDLEQQVRQRGGLTIFLGTDDEAGLTSLSEMDLYTDLPRHISEVRNLGQHPYEFYAKLGFTIVGVLPDANGRGKPDIFMAKRVGGE